MSDASDAESSQSGRALWRRLAGSSTALWGSAVLAFVGSVVAARALGPAEYGEVVLALAAATLVATLLDLSLEAGVVHHGARALAEGQIAELRALVKGAFVLDVGLGLAVAAAIVVFAAPIADVASGGRLEPSIVQLAALVPLAATIDGTTGGVLLIANRPELRAWGMAAPNLARLAAIVVAVGVGGAEAVVAAYAVGTAAGSAFQAYLAWRTGWRRWQGDRSRVHFRRLARQLVSFAVHSSLSTTIVSGTSSLVLILLGRSAGPSAVAFFRIARLPEMAGGLASAPARLVMFAENARLVANGRSDELERVIYRWSGISLALGLPAAVVGWFLLPELITTFYGERYAAATTAARILLITAVLQFAFPWMRNFPAVIGRPRLASALSGVLMIVALPITAVFAEHGADAAAAGVSAGVAAMTVGYLWVARRYFKSQRRGQGG